MMLMPWFHSMSGVIDQSICYSALPVAVRDAFVEYGVYYFLHISVCYVRACVGCLCRCGSSGGGSAMIMVLISNVVEELR